MTTDPVPSPALLAEVLRGAYVESRHFGHAVAVNATGEILWATGNPNHEIYPRSSLKPLQALAGVARGIDTAFSLTDAEIAVICASHRAEPRHRETVAGILAKIQATEDDLHCGPHPVPDVASRNALIRAGQEPTRIYNNCSGKHSGMLALARVLGVPLTGYWEPEHPVQREIQRILALACDTGPEGLSWGVDGCAVPTYRIPLWKLALGFARLNAPTSLPEPEGAAADRIVRAMIHAPEMVSGEGGLDTLLMRELPGLVISKGGAEGCEAVGIVGRGVGLAVKVEDGSARALSAIVLEVLNKLNVLPEELSETLAARRRPPVLNTRGDIVGEIRPAL